MTFRIRVHRSSRTDRRRSPRSAYAAIRSSQRFGLLVPIGLGIAFAIGGFEIAFGDRSGFGPERFFTGEPAGSVADGSVPAGEEPSGRETLAVTSDLAVVERSLDPMASRPSLGEDALVPRELLQLAPGTSAAIVDLARYQMHVYRERDGRSTRVAEYRVSIGENGGFKEREGDKKTPVGVYFIESYLPGSRLPDLYGAGAFPVNYPNLWDRRLGRSGSGIWIHGTETGLVSRPPRSSRGCVTLANPDFETLFKQVAVGGSAVIFAGEIQWRSAADVASEGAELRRELEGWRLAWETLDTERYLAYYASDFRSGSKDFEQWAAHKRRVNKAKKFIEVDIEMVGVFRYPGNSDLVLVDFEQDYRSSNYNTSTHKRQYWRRGDAGWRILHEDRTPSRKNS